jgi:hypothetical protein
MHTNGVDPILSGEAAQVQRSLLEFVDQEVLVDDDFLLKRLGRRTR